ncbi:hypothetical protein MTY66_35820 [Mycolicibacterium sp. TY66]|nr:hypothetical protein MTY66_35820 [Mycolicibacterium sp. TY66]BCJ80397.1 hypothetical protein MTY81_17700 [Mycolicibacterium sp. TY81]
MRRIEDAVQGERQLHDAQVGAQMPAGGGHLVHQEFPDLGGKFRQLRLRQVRQISWAADLFKHSDSLRTHPG